MTKPSPAAQIVDLIKSCDRDEAIAVLDCALIVARGQGVEEGLKQGYASAQATIDEVFNKHATEAS